MAKRTMTAFGELSLAPVEAPTPEEIREARVREKAGQAVVARCLSVTTGLVSQWEQGEKRPRGASLKLLTVVIGEAARRAASPGPRDRHVYTVLRCGGRRLQLRKLHLGGCSDGSGPRLR